VLAIIKAIIYIATLTGAPIQNPTDVCENDLSHLNNKTRIEISIGCSKVNGYRYYPSWRLEELYEEK